MNIILVGAGAAAAALVVIVLLAVIILGHRSPWILVLLGVAVGCLGVCGVIVWRAVSALARM